MISDGKKYDFIPPEGGWGYLILSGVTISMVCGIGSVPTLGIIFSDFLNDIGASSDTIAVIISFYFISFNFSGSPRLSSMQICKYKITILTLHSRFNYKHFA